MHSELVPRCDLIAQSQELVTLELNESSALLAIQMVVLRVAVIVFIHRSPIQLKTA